MNKEFEKIIEKLEEEKMSYFLTIANTGDEKLDYAYEQVVDALDNAIEIVKKASAEYNNGCIPCSDILPQESLNSLIGYNAKPLTKNGKCISCGADVVIHISKYNGHKSFHCDKCGCSVIE